MLAKERDEQASNIEDEDKDFCTDEVSFAGPGEESEVSDATDDDWEPSSEDEGEFYTW